MHFLFNSQPNSQSMNLHFIPNASICDYLISQHIVLWKKRAKELRNYVTNSTKLKKKKDKLEISGRTPKYYGLGYRQMALK